MLPRETKYSKLPRRGGAGKRAIGRPRSTRIPPPASFASTGAPPISFASTPLRAPPPQALADDLAFIFDPSSTSTPMSPRSIASAGPPPRQSAVEEQDGFDPFAPTRPASPPAARHPPRYTNTPSVKYEIPYGRHSKIIPSFEPTAEVVADMMAFEAEAEPAAQTPAPVKIVIPMEDERQPKVIPSFECSPEMDRVMPEEAPIPTGPPLRHTVVTTPYTPAPVKLEIPMDDRRRSKVIPSYERTPEEMLPPVEPARPLPKKRHTTTAVPRYSSGGMMWEHPIEHLRSRKRTTVRHSFETDEEPELILEPPPFPPPQLPARAQPQRRTGISQSRAGVPKRELVSGLILPSKPKKTGPRINRTPEEKIVKKKPAEEKTAAMLQVGRGVTHGEPPETCTRKITSVYYSNPPQEGATVAKVCEEIVEVHGEPEPEPEPEPELAPKPKSKPVSEMVALARQRRLEGSAISAAGGYPGRKPTKLAGVRAKPHRQEELDMIALARQRWMGGAAGSRGSKAGSLATHAEEEEPEEAPAPKERRPAATTAPPSRGYQGRTYRRQLLY